MSTSPPKRRRADAERNIVSIINAALEALASDPDASMAQIARRAGVVRATIYMHFPTREALLDAVMENATTQVADATRAAEPERGEPAEALERGAKADAAGRRGVARRARRTSGAAAELRDQSSGKRMAS